MSNRGFFWVIIFAILICVGIMLSVSFSGKGGATFYYKGSSPVVVNLKDDIWQEAPIHPHLFPLRFGVFYEIRDCQNVQKIRVSLTKGEEYKTVVLPLEKSGFIDIPDDFGYTMDEVLDQDLALEMRVNYTDKIVVSYHPFRITRKLFILRDLRIYPFPVLPPRLSWRYYLSAHTKQNKIEVYPFSP